MGCERGMEKLFYHGRLINDNYSEEIRPVIRVGASEDSQTIFLRSLPSPPQHHWHRHRHTAWRRGVDVPFEEEILYERSTIAWNERRFSLILSIRISIIIQAYTHTWVLIYSRTDCAVGDRSVPASKKNAPDYLQGELQRVHVYWNGERFSQRLNLLKLF